MKGKKKRKGGIDNLDPGYVKDLQWRYVQKWKAASAKGKVGLYRTLIHLEKQSIEGGTIFVLKANSFVHHMYI